MQTGIEIATKYNRNNLPEIILRAKHSIKPYHAISLNGNTL